MAEILDIVVRQRGARTVARDIAKISIAADSASGSLGRLATSTRAAGAAAATSARSTAGATAATVAYGAAANRSSQTLGQFAAAATFAGAAVTAAFGIPLLNAVQTAGDFEAALLRVQNVARATPEQIDSIRESAEELGVTTAFSAGQAAAGFEFLAKAGFDVETQLSAIGPSLSLAAAGSLELGEAANIVTNILSGFRLGVEDLSDSADILTRTAQSSNTDIQQLGQAFSFVAPQAASLNQDILDVSVAIGALGSAGIRGSRAGRNLAIAFESLANQTPAAEAALESLGVNVFDTEGNFRSILEIVDDLREATADLSDEAAATAIGDIFTQQGGRAIRALIGLGDRVDGIRNQVLDFEGAADEAAATLLRGFNGALIELRSATEGLGIAIGDVLLRPLEFLVRGLTGVVRALAALPEPVQAAIAGFFALAAAIGAVVAVGGLLSFAASAAGFASIGLAAAAAGTAITGAAAAVASFAIAIAPIAIPIAAAAAAFFTLKDSEFQVGEATVTLSGILQETASTAGQAISDLANDASLSFQLIRQDLAETLDEVEVFGTGFEAALEDLTFTDFLVGLSGSLTAAGRILTEFVRRAGAGLGGFASDLVDFFAGIPGALRAAISGDTAALGRLFAESFENGVAAQFDGFGERTAAIFEEEFAATEAAFNALGNTEFLQRAAARTGGGGGGAAGDAAVAARGSTAPGGPLGGDGGLTDAEISARQNALAGLLETIRELSSAEEQLADATNILSDAQEANLIDAETAAAVYQDLATNVFTDLRNSVDPVSLALEEQARQFAAVQTAGIAAGISLEEVGRVQALLAEQTRDNVRRTREFQETLSLTESFTLGAGLAFEDFTESLGTQTSTIQGGLASIFQTGLSSLQEFVRTGELDFAAFGQNILGIITDVLVQLLVLQAVQATVGAFGGGGAGGFGGFFANGGPVQGGEPIVVGERGPEMFVPPQSGNIVPNGQMGGSAPPVNVSVVNVADPADVPAAMNSREGEQVIMNTIARNKGQLKALQT